jgi:hypothetical protein
MMKQNQNPQTVMTNGDAAALVSIDVSDDDRISVLSESNKDSLAKGTQKKVLVHKFVAQRQALLIDAKNIDAANSTNLHARLNTIIPQSKTAMKTFKNHDLSTKIVELLGVCQILKDQYDRAGTKETRGNAKISLIVELLELGEKVDQRVKDNIQNSESDPLLKGASLTRAQKERTFSISRVPADCANQICVFCAHFSINEPVENITVVEGNQSKIDEYHSVRDLWTRYESVLAKARAGVQTAKPKHPQTGKGMTRAPRYPVVSSPILQCLCATSKCIQEGTDLGSSCPIKCLSAETGERYPFENGKCTCPYCDCCCSKAYNVSDAPRIGMKILQVQQNQGRHQNVPPEVATATFLSQMMGASIYSANVLWDKKKIDQEAANPKKKPLDAEVQQEVQHFFNADLANALVRNGCNHDLPVESILQMTSAFGTETNVTLPSGDKYDTKRISKSQHFHARNNHLHSANTVATLPPAKGMLDQLNIDYGSMSDTFRLAASKPNLASMLFSPPAASTSTTANSSFSSIPKKKQRVVISILSDSEDDRKMPAALEFGVDERDGYEKREAIATNTRDRIQTESTSTPRKLVWDRTVARNNTNKQMQKKKGDLLTPEKEMRKASKKLDKHMRKNQHDYRAIAEGLVGAQGMNGKDLGEWVDSEDYQQMDSQQLVQCYTEGYMSDDSD